MAGEMGCLSLPLEALGRLAKRAGLSGEQIVELAQQDRLEVAVRMATGADSARRALRLLELRADDPAA
jgi:hypothetical protein